jgi:titin
VNGIGSGPRSNELSAALAEAPSAPTLLGAPADGAVALSWTEPEDDGGSPISGFNLYRRVAGGLESLLATTGATETIYVDFAVTNGTEYTYRVAAVNVVGEGARSSAVSVTPTSPNTIEAPDPPQSLTGATAKGKNASGLVLSWAAPADDGGSPIASYFVYRQAPGETSFTLIGLTDASTRTYSDRDVARRTTYTYAVTAFNSYYESAHSNEATIRAK